MLDQKPIWTGIEGVLINGKLAKALNLTQPAGILVRRVAEGSLAWRSGIRGGMLRAVVEGEEVILGGDLILSVNRISVKDEESYDVIYRSIGSIKPGNNLVIDVLRQGQLVSLCIPSSHLNHTVSAAQKR